jgi:hypothetical protein
MISLAHREDFRVDDGFAASFSQDTLAELKQIATEMNITDITGDK